MKKSFVMMIFGLYTLLEICGVVLLSYLTGLILDTLRAVPAHSAHFEFLSAFSFSKKFKFAYCLGG